MGRLGLCPPSPLACSLAWSYAAALQTLITAVGQTAYTVFSVLILLFILMYIFAVLGFSLFGITDQDDMNDWGNLAVAFFTLFSLATVRYLGAVGVGVGPRAGAPSWWTDWAWPGAFPLGRYLAGPGKPRPASRLSKG